MSYGNVRAPSAFTIGGMADEKLAQQLMLYKPVATIRDMKQTFFYTSVNAGISFVHPLRFLVPKDYPSQDRWQWGDINTPPDADNPLPKFVANPWYLPLGTTRSMDISNIVDQLTEIRVPSDKYCIEINLVECMIESDTANWLSIPDYVFVRDVGDNGVPVADTTRAVPTFVRRPVRAYDSTAGSPSIGANMLLNIPDQATKVSSPETLYVRIKELNNGEPYNWSITSTGAYSLDKSHQLLIRHGDMSYANLTLEFGHMLFTGLDVEEEQNARQYADSIKYTTGINITNEQFPLPNPPLPPNQRKFATKYVDFNSEVFNVNGLPRRDGTIAPNTYEPALLDGAYIDEYKCGYYEQNAVVQDATRLTLIKPTNRPPFLLSPNKDLGGLSGGIPPADPPGAPTPDAPIRFAQGLPLRSNQQAKSISFRFLVKVISLF